MRCGRFIIVVICVAGLLVGIQTYPDAVVATGGACTPAGSDDCDGGALAAVDWGILVIFTCEALLKIVAEHSRPWRYFFSAWNVFDFFIVAMCYVPGAGFAAVLRLLRLLRVLKLVKQLPQLQMIVGGLLNGLTSIGYISLLLALVFYLYGVLGIILFREVRFLIEILDDFRRFVEMKFGDFRRNFGQNDPWHFSTLDIAMLSLFRCATMVTIAIKV